MPESERRNVSLWETSLPELTTTDDVSRYCEIKDEATLRLVVAHWQGILRLQDWVVRAYFAPACDLQEHTLGECFAAPVKRLCDISMLSPEERVVRAERAERKTFTQMETMERTVVHELLHIYTAQMGLHSKDRESKEYIAMEQMVDALAGALTDLHSYFAEAE
jgi:hypothetical protein